jgi:hypothetical protein
MRTFVLRVRTADVDHNFCRRHWVASVAQALRALALILDVLPFLHTTTTFVIPPDPTPP